MWPDQITVEPTPGGAGRNLSDYWRIDRSTDRSRELSSALGGAAAQAELVRRRLRPAGGRTHTPVSSPVILDPRLVSGFAAPIPGVVVDCLVGLAIREVALRELSVASSRWREWPDLNERDRTQFARLHCMLEEVYVSERLGRLSKTLSSYLREMRRTVMPWRIPKGVAAVDLPLSRHTVTGLWLGYRLHGWDASMLGGSDLRQAVTGLDKRVDKYLKVRDALRRLCLAGDIWKWLESFPSLSEDSGGWFSGREDDWEGDVQAATRLRLWRNARGGGDSSGLTDLTTIELEAAVPVPPDMPVEPAESGSEVEVVTGELRELGIRASVTTIREARFDSKSYERARRETSREIESVRRIFARLDEVKSRWRYGLRNGKLDGRGLTKAAAGKSSVFKRRDRHHGRSMALVFLIDVSASMRSHMPVVNRAACVVSEALRGLAPRVWYEVLTYTSGGLHPGAPVQLTRLAATGIPLSLADVWTDGGTPTGEAIAAAVLVLRRQRAERKLVLHFTDGHPKDTYVVRQALGLSQRSGIEVLTVSVGAPQETIYGEGKCEMAYSVAELPVVLARLLPRLYYQA